MKTHSVKNLAIFNSIVKGIKMAPIFFIAIYLFQIGLTGTQIGTIYAVATIASIITMLPSGISNDKMSSRKLITMALLLLSLEYLGLALSTNFYTILIVFTIGALGSAVYKTSIESLFYKSANNQDIEKKIGTLQSLAYYTIGIGMISSGLLLNFDDSFPVFFLIIGILFLIAALVAYNILPSNEVSEMDVLHYKKDILRKKVLFFLLIVLLFSLHIGAEQISYGKFLKENLGLALSQVGLYMGLAVMTMGIASTYISKKMKKGNATKVLMFGLLFSGLFHILMTFGSTKLSFIFRVLHEIGDAAIFFFMFYGISKLFDLKRVGGNSSLFALVTLIGLSIGAYFSGSIAETYGHSWPLIISGGTTLLALALTIPYMHLFEHKS